MQWCSLQAGPHHERDAWVPWEGLPSRTGTGRWQKFVSEGPQHRNLPHRGIFVSRGKLLEFIGWEIEPDKLLSSVTRKNINVFNDTISVPEQNNSAKFHVERQRLKGNEDDGSRLPARKAQLKVSLLFLVSAPFSFLKVLMQKLES